MADNYLEKKYEEYKSRKEGRTNHPYNGRKTTVIHKTRRVFVTGGAEGIGKAIVRAFRSAGHAWRSATVTKRREKRQRCRPEPLFSMLT